jgi:hypothetical protein
MRRAHEQPQRELYEEEEEQGQAEGSGGPLPKLLHSLGIDGFDEDALSSHGVTIEDLPHLSRQDLGELGIGVGACIRIEDYLQAAEADEPVHEVLAHYGAAKLTPTLKRCLRRAAVDDPLQLWRVDEAELLRANVPLGLRRALQRAGGATRELAELLVRIEVDGANLPRLLARGIDSVDALLASSDALLCEAGLPVQAGGRIRKWLHGYADEAGSLSSLTTPLSLAVKLQPTRHRRGQGGRGTVEVAGDMQAALALSRRPEVGARLNAQLAARAARR